VSAPEGQRWGRVNGVVPLKDLIATAERWAGEIMECSPVSIQASKEAAMGGLGMPLEEACVHRFPGTETLWKSKDAIEGPLAFAEKRKPEWKNE
jgi:enoyl-CoA hydratase/carnithine racemase